MFGLWGFLITFLENYVFVSFWRAFGWFLKEMLVGLVAVSSSLKLSRGFLFTFQKGAWLSS